MTGHDDAENPTPRAAQQAQENAGRRPVDDDVENPTPRAAQQARENARRPRPDDEALPDEDDA